MTRWSEKTEGGNIIKAEEINSIESEAGIIATLLYHPEYMDYSADTLEPNYFIDTDNKCIYTAIKELTEKGIYTIDSYNIIAYFNSSDATKEFAHKITVEKMDELLEVSDSIARHSVEEYQILVRNVVDAAFRRFTFQKLEECKAICKVGTDEEVEQKIYTVIDDVMMQFTTTKEVIPYKNVIDQCWEEIQSRRNDGFAGIPFKFPSLNEYATIEPGELFIFAGEAKQGKSMLLLNCAIDLLKRDLGVLYLDSELNTRLFTARVLAHLSGIEYKRVVSGNYSGEEAEKIDNAREWMKTRNFTHLYMPMFDQQSIYSVVKKVKHSSGLDVLVVDYFKGSGDGDAFSSYQELGKFTDCVKNQICGDLGICGIGAAQATSAGRVADSAKIGRNASTIALIQDKTPEEIEEDGEECGNKKLRIILNRNGMQHAEGEYISLHFDGNHILYEEAKQHIPRMPY